MNNDEVVVFSLQMIDSVEIGSQRSALHRWPWL